jgi:arginase
MLDRPIHLLGVPMDLGGGLRGVDMGPSAIRIAGLKQAVERLGLVFVDSGNVQVVRPEERTSRTPKAHYLREIANCCRRLRGRIERVLEDGGFPLVVGGDHSIACGTVAGISSWYQQRGERVGLIWFDAHADMNTPETSPSGNVHGMPLASCLGYGPEELAGLGERLPMVDAKNAVLIGIRDVDQGEREMVAKSGIKAFSMRELDILGMDRVMQEAIAIATDGTAGFHLSFDLDGVDPVEAPGVGTPVSGGVTQRESHLLMEHAAESGRLLGLELTEINPVLDERNRTAHLAVALILSALGKRIV